MKRFLLLISVFITGAMASSVMAAEPHIIPQPSYIDMSSEQGYYTVTEKSRIVVYDEAWAPARLFAEEMQNYFGSKKPLRLAKRGNGIKVRTDNFVPAEGYEMTVNEREILITGGSEAGIYYGLQTLRQMIVEGDGKVPFCDIADELKALCLG